VNTVDDYPTTMTIEQAGELLGLPRSSAYRAAAKGELPTWRFGRRLLVPTLRLLSMLGVDNSDFEIREHNGS
jgi:excisionase family DNA binding protein